MTATVAIFSARQVELEDAQAEAQEIIERQLVTEEMAREFRLTDFLAAGFAEYERRYRAMPLDEKVALAFDNLHQTPEEYGRAIAPAFVDILKELAGVVAHGIGLPAELLG